MNNIIMYISFYFTILTTCQNLGSLGSNLDFGGYGRAKIVNNTPKDAEKSWLGTAKNK